MQFNRESSLLDSKRLTLMRIMGVIAGLAIAFAFLPWLFSVPFAVTVLGIVILEGMRLPLVINGVGVRRRLPWILWSVTLTACPVAIGVVGVCCVNHGPPTNSRWATRVVE